MLISIANLSAISDEEVLRVIRSINTQLHADFAPYWHMDAMLRLEGRTNERPAADPRSGPHPDLHGDAIIYLWDDAPADHALGYHEMTHAAVPYGFVFTELSRQVGEAWSVTLSHEAMELVGDATANVFAAGPHPAERRRTVFHWYEMCDAVQAESYAIDGVLVSNFVLPAYFTPANETGTRNDFLGRMRKDGTTLPSFGINPGGYVGFFDPAFAAHQTFALDHDELAQTRLDAKAHYLGARRAQRYAKVAINAGPAAPEVRPAAAPSPLTPVLVSPAPAPRPANDGLELPALDSRGLAELEQKLQTNEQETLDEVRRVLKQVAKDWDADQLRNYIRIARANTDAPAESATARRAALSLFLPGARNLPAGFTFEGMTREIPIDPANCQFEEDRDAWGWLRNAGWAFFQGKAERIERAPFRAPDPRFEDEPDGSGITTIALASDFGTGLYHSRYIARHIQSFAPRYMFHLGDVYYAGKQEEFSERFAKVLEPLLGQGVELFSLNANHEMLSGGRWYYDYLDAKQRAHGARQRQRSSCFALQIGRFRFVAIDSDHQQESRLVASTLPFVEAQLRRDSPDQINILLSSNEPYTFGSPKLADLFKTDIKSVADKIDLWFWGNTHYCAVFNRRDQATRDRPALPFIGSCIGHGGYPYDVLKDIEKNKLSSIAEVDFVEDRTRFWGTNVRPDRGNNGFLMLRLDHTRGTVQLDYLDWRKIRRMSYVLGKPNGNGPFRIIERRPGG